MTDTENSTMIVEDQQADLPTSCQLTLILLDVVGNPIKDLDYRIDVNGKPYKGISDGNGQAQILSNQPFGALAQIYVKRMDGSYKFIGESLLDSVEANLCAVSPKVLIETETVMHEGEEGQADVEMDKIDAKIQETKQDATEATNITHEAMVEATTPIAQTSAPATATTKNTAAYKPKTTGGKVPQTDTKAMRDKDGKPHVVVHQMPDNWFNKNFPGAYYIWRLTDFLKPAPIPSPIPKKADFHAKAPTVKTQASKTKSEQNKIAKPTKAITHAPTTAPSTHAAVPVPVSSDYKEQLDRLFTFAEKQATWKYPDPHTIPIANLFTRAEKNGLDYFVEEGGKGQDYVKAHTKKRSFEGHCYPYVKIALWHCGIVNGLLAGERPGSEAGLSLLQFGFRDVTAEVPDPRWAAPGDVITYQWTDETWEKKKKGNPNKPNYGHIEIRTYDGYISDGVIGHYMYNTYTNIHIYRKVYDPLPAKRVRAFLMVIASRESKTIFKRDGYQETYRTLPENNKDAKRLYPGKDKFDSFKTHPLDGFKTNASGAYGMLSSTWRAYLPYLDLPENANMFSPIEQDRLVVTILERTKNALGFVRRGEIEKAAKLLTTHPVQFSSLPGGGEEGDFTINDMMSSYNKFLKDLE